MKKHYCIFSAQYLPHMGGVERYTYNLAKKLCEYGNEVTIVTSNGCDLSSYEKKDGITIFRLPCFMILDGRYPIIKFNRKFWKLNRLLTRKKYDMVIVNTRFYIHSIYGMRFAKKINTKCITIEHGTSHLSVHNKLLDTVGAVYEHAITWIGKKLCDNYYGVSLACNDWLEHFHIKAKGVLYNSIDLDEVEKIKKCKRKSYREEYGITEDTTVITFTGRLLKEKGLPSLLNVMDKLYSDTVNAVLFIAGDGDMEEEIEQRKSNYIIPIGRIPFEDIVDLLDESDIFCLPSFSEGFSTSILEAVACRCYIVTTARGGAKELLIDDTYGSVIESNEETLLYNALKEAIENPKKRKIGAEQSYEMLKSNFTWDHVAKKVEENS